MEINNVRERQINRREIKAERVKQKERGIKIDKERKRWKLTLVLRERQDEK